MAEDEEHPDLTAEITAAARLDSTVEDESLQKAIGGGIFATDGVDPRMLCIAIQSCARDIFVRVNLDGTWKDTPLTELPAPLAVWWALEFVKRHIERSGQ